MPSLPPGIAAALSLVDKDTKTMNAATPHSAHALSLILEQCARMGGSDSRERTPAASRLEQRLGSRLARLLISALSGDHRDPRAV